MSKCITACSVQLCSVTCHKHFYPVRICATGLCVRSRQFVYVCICMSTKTRMFSALPLKNFLGVFYYFLTCLQCGLLHPASCCRQSNSCFFQIRCGAPSLALNHFLLSFNGTSHPLGLGSTVAGDSCSGTSFMLQ